jgi:hypothetical protein
MVIGRDRAVSRQDSRPDTRRARSSNSWSTHRGSSTTGMWAVLSYQDASAVGQTASTRRCRAGHGRPVPAWLARRARRHRRSVTRAVRREPAGRRSWPRRAAPHGPRYSSGCVHRAGASLTPSSTPSPGALDSVFAGRLPYEEALLAYQRTRDDTPGPMYEFTADSAYALDLLGRVDPDRAEALSADVTIDMDTSDVEVYGRLPAGWRSTTRASGSAARTWRRGPTRRWCSPPISVTGGTTPRELR